MSRSEKLGFYFGVVLIIILRITIYAFVIFGIVISIINKEIPYWPVAIFLLYQIWKNMVLFSSMVKPLSMIAASVSARDIRVNKKDTEDLIKLINILHLTGGNLNK